MAGRDIQKMLFNIETLIAESAQSSSLCQTRLIARICSSLHSPSIFHWITSSFKVSR
jgi:hypothetical protein